MIGIAASKKDLAALAMRRHFTKKVEWLEAESIFAEDIDSLGYEALVIASRHKAESGRPTLTVHPNGNYGDAAFGGQPRTLQATAPQLMRNIFLELASCMLEYDVSLEVTHHGPTGFRTSLVWAELGSTEKQWQDDEAAAFLVQCIERGIGRRDKAEVVIGFGGGHYAPKFSELEKGIAFGHMCPKYAADLLDEGLVRQMVEKSGGAKRAVLDDKGLNSAQKQKVKACLTELKVDY